MFAYFMAVTKVLIRDRNVARNTHVTVELFHIRIKEPESKYEAS